MLKRIVSQSPGGGGGGGDSSEVRGVDCQEGIAPGKQQLLMKGMQLEEVQWIGVAPVGSKLKLYELQGGVDTNSRVRGSPTCCIALTTTPTLSSHWLHHTHTINVHCRSGMQLTSVRQFVTTQRTTWVK